MCGISIKWVKQHPNKPISHTVINHNWWGVFICDPPCNDTPSPPGVSLICDLLRLPVSTSGSICLLSSTWSWRTWHHDILLKGHRWLLLLNSFRSIKSVSPRRAQISKNWYFGGSELNLFWRSMKKKEKKRINACESNVLRQRSPDTSFFALAWEVQPSTCVR